MSGAPSTAAASDPACDCEKLARRRASAEEAAAAAAAAAAEAAAEAEAAAAVAAEKGEVEASLLLMLERATIAVKQTRSEVVKRLGMNATRATCAAIFAEFDPDGSGEVDYQEFMLKVLDRSTDHNGGDALLPHARKTGDKRRGGGFYCSRVSMTERAERKKRYVEAAAGVMQIGSSGDGMARGNSGGHGIAPGKPATQSVRAKSRLFAETAAIKGKRSTAPAALVENPFPRRRSPSRSTSPKQRKKKNAAAGGKARSKSSKKSKVSPPVAAPGRRAGGKLVRV